MTRQDTPRFCCDTGATASKSIRYRAAGVALATTLLIAPTSALSQSCAQHRPNWTPGDQVSALSEAVALFGSPVALVLLLATALCLRFRHQWGAVVIVVLWTVLVSLVTFTDAGGRAAGTAEGCIGSPSLFITAVAALCVGLILYTAPKPQKDAP